MKGITRFTEYSITGGLLWFNIFIFATLIFMSGNPDNTVLQNAFQLWNDWINNFNEILAPSSESALFSKSFSAVAAVLGITFIFCTGLLLDLLSPLFCTPLEVVYFKKQLKHKNQRWLSHIMNEHTDFLGDDFKQFIEQPLFEMKQPRTWQQQKSRYNRMHTFLNSYLYVYSGDALTDQVIDKMRLWRTSRAITTSVILLCVLLNFLVITESNILQDNAHAALFTIVMPLILFIASLSISTSAYARLTVSLLSMTYHIHQKQRQENGSTTIAELNEEENTVKVA